MIGMAEMQKTMEIVNAGSAPPSLRRCESDTGVAKSIILDLLALGAKPKAAKEAKGSQHARHA
jgi:hypothetical protein